MKKVIFSALVAALFVCSCTSKDKNTGLETSSTKDSVAVTAATAPTSDLMTVTIASKQADCTGVGKQKCFLVKEGDATDWLFWYNGIEGFDYQEGYEYVLEVRKVQLENVPADAPSLKYVFMKEISKTQKESEGMSAERK